MDFSFGCDPEFFLCDGLRYVSAIGVVNGTRDKRVKKHGHQFFYDNVLAECSVAPAKTRLEAVENIGMALATYAEMVKPLRLNTKAAVVLPDNELRHKDARKAGCNKEWSIYTRKQIPIPSNMMKQSNLRTAGGHIHLGATNGPLQDQVHQPFVIYMLDLFLAVPALFVDKDQSSIERRRMYGKAGSYRQKEYGIEYRPLSAFWLNCPAFVDLTYEICDFVLDFVANGRWSRFWTLDEEKLMGEDPNEAYHCYGYDVFELRRVIDTCDLESGRKFMEFIQNYLPERLSNKIEIAAQMDKRDLYQAWGLDA